MPQLSLDTSGLAALDLAAEALRSAVRKGAAEGAKRAAPVYAAALRRAAPQRTGRLSRSIRVSAAGTTLRVSAAFYAAAVDERTGFADDAYRQSRQAIDREYIRAINREIARAGN